jgi:hypothetical protein
MKTNYWRLAVILLLVISVTLGGIIMAWTAPTTRIVGEFITAPIWNTDLVDNLDYLKTLTQQGCKLTMSGDQAIPDTTDTKIEFDTEVYDNGGLHESVTNPSRITIVEDGIYLFGFDMLWEAEAAAVGGRSAYFLINNAPTAQGDKTHAAIANNKTVRLHCAVTFELVATDYVEVEVYHDLGAATDVISQTVFWCNKLSD